MQDVLFRTRDDTADMGTPTRAKPCRCNRQVIDSNDGFCITCGREPAYAIRHQWDQQRWVNRKDARPTSQRPFREGQRGGLFKVAA